jgi:hypothetical protein
MEKDLYGILLEESRVLIVGRNGSNENYWTIPMVSSNNNDDFLYLLSKEMPDYDFSSARSCPFMFFGDNAEAHFVTGYSRNGSVYGAQRLWVRGIQPDLLMDESSLKILKDLEKRDQIFGTGSFSALY